MECSTCIILELGRWMAAYIMVGQRVMAAKLLGSISRDSMGMGHAWLGAPRPQLVVVMEECQAVSLSPGVKCTVGLYFSRRRRHPGFVLSQL